MLDSGMFGGVYDMVVVIVVSISVAADLLRWEVWYGGVGFGGGEMSLDPGVIAATHTHVMLSMAANYMAGMDRRHRAR